MMQSCASAAKLRGGGPILNRGSNDHVRGQVAATSVRHLQLAMKALQKFRKSSGRSEGQSHWGFAGGDEPPEGNEKLPRQGHNHGLPQTGPAAGRPRPIPIANGLSF